MDVRVCPLPSQDNAAALDLWEGSVRATHHFVTEEHIQQYKVMVREMLEARPLHMYGLYGPSDFGDVDEKGSVALVGIMGIESDDLCMLFVEKDQRGRGHGRTMTQYALNRGVRKVDVNEQNVQARAFYERMGFVARGVAPLDGVGNPYPLVHMELA